MEKLKCTISYDGTHFFGSQIQPNKRTVQGEIERALQKMHDGKHVRIYASGRTDTGVHAKGQVFHFETYLSIPERNWKRAPNSLLPDDIYVHEVKRVAADFHAQFDCVAKEYRYFILQNKEKDVFRRHFTYHYPYVLDLSQMKRACELFQGTHDFTSFCAAGSSVKGSKVRTLYEVRVEQKKDEIMILLPGDGFLYNMVRIIVGVLLDVGNGRLKADDIPVLIAAKDREKVSKTAPANGLFLWDVIYES